MYPTRFRRGIVRVLITALLGICALAAQAAADEDPRARLLEHCGFLNQLDQLPEQFKAGLRMGMPETPNKDRMVAAISSAVDGAFDADARHEQALAALRAALTPAEAQQLAEWFETPLGQRIVAAEAASADPANLPERLRVATQLMSDPERVARAQRILEILDLTDYVLETQMRLAGATFLLLTSHMPPGAAPDLDTFQASLAAKAPQLRFQINQGMLAEQLYSYRDFDPAEQDRYIAFLDRPLTHTFNGALIALLQDVNDRLIAASLDALGVELQGLVDRDTGGSA